MSRAVAVLRPEPGNAETAARVAAAGLTPIRLPLFETGALRWTPPDPAGFDALILTSANAARLGGAGLATLAALPVHAVGAATARAATAAGLRVVATGGGDARALLTQAAAAGVRRALFLSGRDRTIEAGGIVARAIAVYASDPLPANVAVLTGATVLLHSPRAARRLGALVDAGGLSRASIALAALSVAVARAAGDGWAAVAIAPRPDDAALIAAAATLSD